MTASDGTNTSSESQLTVNITRVNDNAPTIDTAAGSTVTEESVSTSTVVATFTASDLDDQDNVTYEITSGNDNNYSRSTATKGHPDGRGRGGDQQRCGRGPTSLTLGVTASDGTNTSSESHSDGEHHTRRERQCTDDRHGGRQHRDRRVGEHLNSGSDVHGERPG
nr:cadherin repeat domain-containing protein [Vibrio vulnificus]